MNLDSAKSVIENILFVADRPLTLAKIVEIFNGEINKADIKEALDKLKTDYEQRGIQLVEIAEGYQLCTRPEASEWVKRFYTIEKGSRLSQASMETLSIIAYKQPITRIEIEEIRGVDSGGVIKTLLEKNLTRNIGRKKIPGRPMMYGTTRKFLEYFGLKNLADLPTLEELKEEESGENSLTKEKITMDELKLHEAVLPEKDSFRDIEISPESDETEDSADEREEGD